MKLGSNASPASRRGATLPPKRTCRGVESWRDRDPPGRAPASIPIPVDRCQTAGRHGHLADAVVMHDRTPCGFVAASLASVVTDDAVRLARSAGPMASVARDHATRTIPPRHPGRAGPPSASRGRGGRS